MEGFDYRGGTVGDASKVRVDPETSKHKHGVIPRAIEAVFDRACQRMKHNARVKYKLKCSYFQIYNERVHDLLNPASLKKKNGPDSKKDDSGLRIRWSKNNTFYVENLFVFECDTAAQARDLFVSGVKNKSMGSHQMNLQSSRSHSLYTLYVESWDPQAPDCVIKSELTLVDLAGSEKLTLMSKNPSAKLVQESIEINASLLALGKVISALGSGRKNAHVPYRDAKLTKLLKHALGGNSLTLMIACINPCDAYVEETVSTLFYAGRARNIRNDPRVNEDSKTSLIKALRAEIASLKTELNHYRKLAMDGGGGGGRWNADGIAPRSASGVAHGGKDDISFEGRPHTAGEAADQTREVAFLGEKLVDSVKMLKDIIMVNGQLREAFDEVSRVKSEGDANLSQLNEENTTLRERIEMLESIVMQEAEGGPLEDYAAAPPASGSVPHIPSNPRGAAVSSPPQTHMRPTFNEPFSPGDPGRPPQAAFGGQPAPTHGNAKPRAHNSRTAAASSFQKKNRKALERYQNTYKQQKLPSYEDYYSVAATKRRQSGNKPKAKKGGAQRPARAFDNFKSQSSEPLFTRRAVDTSGPGGLQSAAAMALEFSAAATQRNGGPYGGGAFGPPKGEAQSPGDAQSPMMTMMMGGGDSELEARRRARRERAAALEQQHRSLQQRHAVAAMASSSSGSATYAMPSAVGAQGYAPQAPQYAAPPMSQSVGGPGGPRGGAQAPPVTFNSTAPVSAPSQSFGATQPQSYLTQEEAQSFFSAEQLAIINRRRQMDGPR
eukprot:TRINITY_DN4419_c0_g3_i1.p1 TRINITY_DN4419_c0_g3~~TRINITY_DN4419_c0_g3_i1.p1  ORF type:complete len:907 (+),score=285.91 TRINITY_DN4419_c0_g3_i1:392-2722(+)